MRNEKLHDSHSPSVVNYNDELPSVINYNDDDKVGDIDRACSVHGEEEEYM